MQYDLAEFALKMTAPNNKLIYDDKGIPSVMVYVPKMKMKDLITGGSDSVHPAFIVDGQEVDGIWISKYQNVVNNGRAYSIPGADPKASITWDTARGYCEAKGKGWHMMTRAEYALILLWCRQNGFMPYGNNNYGKDSRETLYQAIPATYGTGNDAGKVYHVLTGTGPLTWSHNKQLDGIWDLNGNVSEWTGGIRTVYGELQLLANNNAANSDHPQTATSTEWKAIDATTGAFIEPDGSGTTANSVKVNCVSNKPQFSTGITTRSTSFGCGIKDVTADATIADAAKTVLIAYGIFPDGTAGSYDDDVNYYNNQDAERLFNSGGNYGSGSNAGVGYSNGYNSDRGSAYVNIGWRSAYIELPESAAL